MAALILLAVLAAIIVTPNTARADTPPTACTSSWSGWQSTGSPAWGQWRYCYADWAGSAGGGNWRAYRFQVDDTYTDGYGVHLEMYQAGWQDIQGTDPSQGYWLQSTGDGETSIMPAYNIEHGQQGSVRLVKGVVWPSHQNVAASGSWILVP